MAAHVGTHSATRPWSVPALDTSTACQILFEELISERFSVLLKRALKDGDVTGLILGRSRHNHPELVSDQGHQSVVVAHKHYSALEFVQRHCKTLNCLKV